MDYGIVNKLMIRSGSRLRLRNAPPGYPEALEPLPDGVELLTTVVRFEMEVRGDLQRMSGKTP
jgi:hypothetical protein